MKKKKSAFNYIFFLSDIRKILVELVNKIILSRGSLNMCKVQRYRVLL